MVSPRRLSTGPGLSAPQVNVPNGPLTGEWFRSFIATYLNPYALQGTQGQGSNSQEQQPVAPFTTNVNSPLNATTQLVNIVPEPSTRSAWLPTQAVHLPDAVAFDVNANGGIVDLFLSDGTPTDNGYVIRFDSRNGFVAGQIIKLTNGNWAGIGTAVAAANSATLSGTYRVVAVIGLNGAMAVYVDGELQTKATDTTYTLDGSTFMGTEVIGNTKVWAPTDIDGTLDFLADGVQYVHLASSHASNNVAYNFRGVWTSGNSYVTGDEVVYGQSYWLALANSLGSVPSTGNANWQVVGSYSAFLGAWSSTTGYAVGAEVTYLGNYWVAIAANLNSAPTLVNANWQIAGPSTLDNVADGATYVRLLGANAAGNVAYNYKGAWSSSTPYVTGDEVVYSTTYWVCVTNNTNSTPSTSNALWVASGSYAAFQGAWSNSTAYSPGAEVTYGGNYWIAVAASTNSAPTLVNANWQIAGPSNTDAIVPGTGTGAVTLAVIGAQRNLVPDSGFKSAPMYWSGFGAGNWNVTHNLDGHTNCAEYVGTGSPSGYIVAHTVNINVIPGTYTLSAVVYGGAITTGVAEVAAYDPTISTYYGGFTFNATNAGAIVRAQNTITIPAGVSQIVIIVDTSNSTVTNGAGVFVQQIQLEPGGVMTAYQETTGDDNQGTILINFANGSHVNKNVDNIGDGSSFVRLLASRAAGNVAYNFRGVWSSGPSYLKGDEVVYGTTYWVALANSANSMPSTSNANWQASGSYSAYQGAWSSSTTYVQGDEVTYIGNYWFCVTGNTNSAPSFVNVDWQVAGPDSLDDLPDGASFVRLLASRAAGNVAYNFRGVWNSGASYLKGDEVVYGTTYWVALASSTNSAPSTSNANWQASGSYSAYQGAWSNSTAYVQGDEVTYIGNYWFCVTGNTNSAPSFINVNWQAAGPTSLDSLPDGSTYLRMPGANMDPNRRGLIDFSQSGHTNLPLLDGLPSIVSTPTSVTNLLSGSYSLSQFIAGNSIPILGAFAFDVNTGSNGIIDVLLYAVGASGQTTGYMVRFDSRAGNNAGYVIKWTNGSGVIIGAAQTSANAALLTGWHTVVCRITTGGVFDVFVDGLWQWSATDTSYTLSGATYYGYEVASGQTLAPPDFINRTIDHVPDGSTYARPKSAGLTAGVTNTTGLVANAATNPTSASAGTTTLPTCCSVGITTSGGAVLITCMSAHNVPAATGFSAEIDRDGTAVSSFSGAYGTSSPAVLTYIDTPPAGAHTYALKLTPNSGSYSSVYSTIQVVELKR